MQTIAINTESANLSEEQFFRLCAGNKGLRMERDKNKNIIIMSPTDSSTGKFNFSIAARLAIWNEKAKTGYGFDSSTGFNLPDGSMRSPDVSWVAKQRWDIIPQSDQERFAPLCPDFIIEIRSKTDTLKQLKDKMQEWLSNGCLLAWLIDLENQTTYIYKPNSQITEQSFSKILSGETVLDGFELILTEIIN